MTVLGPPPVEWKSAKWWSNRPLHERLGWANIPKRLLGTPFDWNSLPESKVEQLTQWFTTWESHPMRNVLISGPSKSGKSSLGVALLHSVASRGASIRFVNADRYVEMLKDQFDNDNELPEMYNMPHLVKYIKGTFDVVLLDAMGQERLTEFSQHEIGSLIRRRHDDMRPIIMTTHLSPTDLVRRYGDRISSAMDDTLVVVMR